MLRLVKVELLRSVHDDDVFAHFPPGFRGWLRIGHIFVLLVRRRVLLSGGFLERGPTVSRQALALHAPDVVASSD